MSEEKLDLQEEEIEIIDFQSENKSSSQTQAPRPVPANIKWIFASLGVVLIAGAGSLFALSQQSKPVELSLDVDAETSTETAIPVNTASASLDNNNAAGTVARATPGKSQVVSKNKPLVIGPVTEQDKIREQVASMTIQVDEVTARIKTLETQNQDLTRHVQQILKIAKAMPSKEDLAAIRQDLESMMQKKSQELQKSIEAKTKKLAKTKSVKKRVYRRYTLPFKLVSIDQWDGLNYAAIQANNISSIENLRTGDVRFGWKVKRIDPLKGQVEFKHLKSGRTVKQTAI